MAEFRSRTITMCDGATLTLRSPYEDEAPLLLAYLDQIRRETRYLVYGPDDELPSLEQERQFIAQHRDSTAGVLVGAWAGGRLVALAGAMGGAGHARLRHRAEVGISVLAAWCDRGLGTLLMCELVAFARSTAAIDVLRLGVYTHNHRAIAVYHKLGFEAEGRRRWAVRYEDGGYADELMMSLWTGPGDPPPAYDDPVGAAESESATLTAVPGSPPASPP